MGRSPTMQDSGSDIEELRRIKYRCLALLPFFSFLAIVSSFAYFAMRVSNLIEAARLTDSYSSCFNSALYLLIEVGLLLPNLLDHSLRCLALGGQGASKMRHLRLVEQENVPRVDVFITCAGEEVETIINTVEAACALDYPQQKFRVLVFDDAGSEELRNRVEELKTTRANLFYSAREKEANHHFKAGNLNHALQYAGNLPEGPASLIAALDADMIPAPEWLRALIPHILSDDNIALVQPPQVSNLSSIVKASVGSAVFSWLT